MNSYERKHLHILSKQELLPFTEWAVSLGPSPKTKFQFISPAVKSNVNIIFFYEGLKFHFGSQCFLNATLTAKYVKCIHTEQ